MSILEPFDRPMPEEVSGFNWGVQRGVVNRDVNRDADKDVNRGANGNYN